MKRELMMLVIGCYSLFSSVDLGWGQFGGGSTYYSVYNSSPTNSMNVGWIGYALETVWPQNNIKTQQLVGDVQFIAPLAQKYLCASQEGYAIQEIHCTVYW